MAADATPPGMEGTAEDAGQWRQAVKAIYTY
jgi:hypothetical protein